MTTLFAHLSELAILALIVVSFVTSFISSALGIGGGALLLTVLATILPPAALIPVHGVIQLGSNAGRVTLMYKYIDRSVIKGFLTGSVLGVALGGFVAVRLPPPLVLIGVGAFVLWSVFAPASGALRGSALVAGGISSTLTMFFGATGPLVAAWIKTLGVSRMAHVATQSACLSLQHLLKTVMFGLLGFSFITWLPLIGLMIAAGFGGTWIGKKVLMRIDDRKFKRSLNSVLTVLAIYLIWRGMADLLPN